MKLDIKNIPLYLIYIAPTVHLAFGKRFGDLFNVLSIVCLIYIFRNGIEGKIDNKKLFYFFSFLFFVYPLEIFISQLFRWQWRIHDYMDQIRFIFAYPVFLYLINRQLDPLKYVERAIPIAIIISYFSTKYFFIDSQYGDRFTNNFTDPLAYGQICISMSLLILVTFLYSKEQSLYLDIYKLLGLVFGFMISIKTQSRTGWLSIPIIAITLIYLNRKNLNFRIVFSILIALSILFVIGFQYSEIINNRVDQAVNEIFTYPWRGGVAPDTSVGLRITFYRIGWFYISHNPWYGSGDKGFFNLITSPELKLFASPYALSFSYSALFHNELLTQTVRYGVLGLLGYLAVFLLPVIIFIKNSSSNIKEVKDASVIGLVFLITQMISGISDEVLNLKYMILYFMLIMAICYSVIISKKY